eukprot:COSAG02_NODE_4098_length_5781_cov_13.744984_1_plen_130_part_00
MIYRVFGENVESRGFKESAGHAERRSKPPRRAAPQLAALWGVWGLPGRASTAWKCSGGCGEVRRPIVSWLGWLAGWSWGLGGWREWEEAGLSVGTTWRGQLAVTCRVVGRWCGGDGSGVEADTGALDER